MVGMSEIVRSDKEILGGTPCFAGTRVPIKSLFDYLEGDYSIDFFLEQFPSVQREQVMALLESVRCRAEDDAVAAARR
jgi:uncharacterized protein (DUF433 family)